MALPNAWPAVGDTGWAAALQGNVNFANALAESAVAASATVPGVIAVDSFSGGNDAAKMNAALSYAAAQTYIPWLQMPFRVFDTGASTFAEFTGMKIVGAGVPYGPKNLEISGGKPVSGRWQTSCGNGASSLLQATGTVYDVVVSGVAFQGGSGSQIFRSTVNSYACAFNNLTFYGCKHAFGNPGEKFLATQVLFDGHWTSLGFFDTQITVGGSDCLFQFYFNAGEAASGAGKPIVLFDSLAKTSINYLYLTNTTDWVGLRVLGSVQFDTTFFMGTYEGKNSGALGTRPVIDIQGGHVVMYSPHVGYVSDVSGTANGVITVSGGILDLYSPNYLRGSGVAATFPLVYQTGGVCRVQWPVSAMGDQIRIRRASGTVETLSLPADVTIA